MRNATPAFMRALAADKRDYANRVIITLADGTVLYGTETTYDEDTGEATVTSVPYLTNENILEDGAKMEDAVSADDEFQVGAAIINQGTFALNNIDGRLDPYSFDGASVVWSTGLTGLDDGTSDFLKMGTFNVDETEYDGSVITLKCLDNMAKFDRPYTFDRPTDVELSYPAQLGDIVRNACDNCGVSLASNSRLFPHYDYEVQTKPSGESTTYRQVISWAAQIAVCFARCNPTGELEIKFYDTSVIDAASSDDLDGGVFDASDPYASGDDANGGVFNPWGTVASVDGGNFTSYPKIHYISSAYTHKVSTDDVVITGVNVQKKIKTEGSSDAYETFSSGTSGYVISVEKNGFIDGTHGQDVADWMGLALIGLTFRKAEVTHPNDPMMEAGDIAYYWDRNGSKYTLLVSSTTFSCNNSQRTVSAAETPAKNSSQRFSDSTRNYVEMREQMSKQYTTFENQQQDLASRIAHASGLYETDVAQPDGSTQRWYHDKPSLNDSEIVMVFNDDGFFVCDDYKTKTTAVPPETPSWYGLEVNGAFLASKIQTIDLFFDYAHGGTLSLGGVNNISGILRVYDSSGNQTGVLDNSGLSIEGSQYRTQTGDGVVTLYADDGSGYWTHCGTISGDREVVDATHVLYTLKMSAPSVIKIGTDADSQYIEIAANYIRPTSLDVLGDCYVRKKLTVLNTSTFRNNVTVGLTSSDNANLTVNGTMTAKVVRATSSKPRLLKGTIYGDRLLYAYETPTPYFGDIGTGRTGESGECVVGIDDIFDVAIDRKVEYVVFLQNEEPGELWVDEKADTYFVVKGTPNTKFAWELKSAQFDAADLRLDDEGVKRSGEVDVQDVGLSMEDELEYFDEEEFFADDLDLLDLEDLFDADLNAPAV